MVEYIKRSDAMKICQEYSSHCFVSNDANGQDIADRIEDDIVKIPTADVVEVKCRCKDCRYTRIMSDGKSLACIRQSAYRLPDDFCSYGERKNEDSN